jgi:alpha-1,3-rhamnosyltransferase
MEENKKVEQCPLVNVLVPAYNHEQYVEEALQSVVDQTYKNIELIVINDGSTDGTSGVIKKYIENNPEPRITFLEQTNEGICKTLNRGLKHAKGKYIAVLASDDLWSPDKIEKQVQLMERNDNIGLVFSDHYFMRGREITNIKATDYKPNIRKCFIKSIQNVNIYERLMIENIIPALTVLMRRDCIDKMGGFDTNLIAEDFDMWLRMAKEYPFAYIDEPLAFYRIHETNLSNRVMSFWGIKLIMKILIKQYRDLPLKNQPFRVAYLFVRFWLTITLNRLKKAFFIQRLSRRIG